MLFRHAGGCRFGLLLLHLPHDTGSRPLAENPRNPKPNHVDQPTRQAMLDAVRPLVSAKTRSAFLKEEAEFLASPVVKQVKGLEAY